MLVSALLERYIPLSVNYQIHIKPSIHCPLLQEGKQASLAADFSIMQFRYLSRLLLVHGRNR